MKSTKKLLSIIGPLLAVFIIGIVYISFSRGLTTNKEVISSAPLEAVSNEIAQNDKVIIKAYINLRGCSPELADLLEQLPVQYPGQVTVEYIDFGTREGAERMMRDGLSCQGLVINGKQTFTINENGVSRQVTFSHPIGQQYTADDLKTIIKLILKNEE